MSISLNPFTKRIHLNDLIMPENLSKMVKNANTKNLSAFNLTQIPPEELEGFNKSA